MIVHKTWSRMANDPTHTSGKRRKYREGWFLFGVLPLYVRNDNNCAG
jgi:hypothetical protein